MNSLARFDFGFGWLRVPQLFYGLLLHNKLALNRTEYHAAAHRRLAVLLLHWSIDFDWGARGRDARVGVSIGVSVTLHLLLVVAGDDRRPLLVELILLHLLLAEDFNAELGR